VILGHSLTFFSTEREVTFAAQVTPINSIETFQTYRGSVMFRAIDSWRLLQDYFQGLDIS